MHLPEHLLSSFAKTDKEPVCISLRRVCSDMSEVFDSWRLQSCLQESTSALKTFLPCAQGTPKQSLHRMPAQPLPCPPHTQLLIHLLTSRFMFSCYFYIQQSSCLCTGVHDAHCHDLTSFPVYVHTWLDHESTQAESHGILFWASDMHSKLSSVGTFYWDKLMCLFTTLFMMLYYIWMNQTFKLI